MTISKELLDIMLILTPGIISFYIIETLTHHKRIEYQRVILNIIVLNFIIYFFIYVVSIFINYCFQDFATKIHLTQEHIFQKDTNITIMSLGLIFSLITGLYIAKAINNKFIFNIAKKLNISNLNSNLNVWDDFLSEERNFSGIIIRDIKNNLMYYGEIKRYSEFSLEKKELHLTDIRIYNNKLAKELYRQEELYLVIDDTMTIEIPKLTKKET